MLERLGSPKKFAASVHEQLGVNPVKAKIANAKLTAAAILLAALSAACVGLFAYLCRLPSGVIGQADTMTSIAISGCTVNLPAVLITFAAAFAAAAVFTILHAKKFNSNVRGNK